MATYLSPGVYVEEVPSVQQPIAGVGTNTAGFIGLIETDEIEYPVPNEDYDPQLAAAALAGPEGSREEIAKLESDAKAAQEKQDQLQRDLDALNAGLAGIDPADQAQRRKFSERDKKQQEVNRSKQASDTIQKKLAELKQPGTMEDKFIRPYLRKSFTLVDPIDAKLCTNFTEYTDHFGLFSIDDPTKERGTALHPGHRALTHAVWGFFKNGGTRCFVVRIKSEADLEKALTELESIDEIALVAAPGIDPDLAANALVTHCQAMEDRFAILDSPGDVESKDELDLRLLTYDGPDNVLPQRNKNAAFYFPYIEVIDPAVQVQDQDPSRNVVAKHRGKVYVPPSGHVAGIYARVDETRGVHKAPGNEPIFGALDVKYYISKQKQAGLNPQGVNCIRNINGNINIWGARTIGGDKNGEWKYINVRRTFLFLKKSIDEGTQWVVFEPNDMVLWGKIRRNVSAFLTNVWRSGALFGATPQEAFYVKCDEETNPLEIRDLGQVVTEVGVAIVRPAEFVIFRVTQWGGPRANEA
jgi:phage tail sheath protein FI